jgi:lysophospholipase L1-like esterase
VSSETSAHGARILALGDSYTIGESVDANDRWPAHLVRRLRESGVSAVEPVIVARTGWTTDELSSAIDEANLDHGFDLVTLLIGVNNQYRGRSAAEYGVHFRDLLARAISFAGSRPSRVVVVSIPDWGATPFAAQSGRDIRQIGAEIDAFNADARTAAGRAGSMFVDNVPITRRAATDARLIASDGLHTSGAMYEEWAKQILPTTLEALRTKPGR